MAVQSDVMEAAGPYDRAKALSAFKLGDVTFYLDHPRLRDFGAADPRRHHPFADRRRMPAMKEYGFCVPVDAALAPSADPPVLGALAPIYGTLVTSFIAMLIAIPVGLGIRDLPHEICPIWLRRPIGLAVWNCSPAFPRSSTACGASSCWGRSSPTRSSLS